MAWRWGAVGHLLPKQVDVAYHLRLNRWNGEESLQLEVVGIRPSSGEALVLQRQERSYWVRLEGNAVVIRNADGEELRGEAEQGRLEALQIDHPKAEHPYVKALVQDAARAMGLAA